MKFNATALLALLIAALVAPLAAAEGEPAAPSNVTVEALGPDALEIDWPPVTDGGDGDVERYYVCDAPTLPTTGTCGSVTGTYDTETGLDADTEYCFNIVTKNTNGKYSQPAHACGRTDKLNPTVPTAPQDFQGAESNQRIDLSWADPASNGGAHYTKTNVYQDGSLIYDNGFNEGRSLSVTGLTNGVAYSFEVAYVNNAGEGARASLTATPGTDLAPEAPSGVDAEVYGSTSERRDRIHVSWNWHDGSSGDSPFAQYCAIATPDTIWSDTGRPVACTPWDSVAVTGLDAGTEYCFRVQAQNENGHWSDPSSQACATTWFNYADTPSAPDPVSVEPADGQATVTWSEPADDGGAEIQEYRIYVDGGLHSTHANNVYAWVVTGLTNGQSYTIEVAAKNHAGEGDRAGNTVTPQLPAGAPGVVTTLDAQAFDSRGIRINWSPPEGVVSGYRLIQGVSGINVGNVLSVDRNFLDPGTEYCYRVQAYNSEGNGPQSAEVCATTDSADTVPGRVQDLVSLPDDGSITLDWGAPASDGGPSIIDYQVYVDGVLHGASLGTLYTVPDLTNGQSYTFDVAARNAVGEGQQERVQDAPFAPVPPGAVRNLAADDGNGAVRLSWSEPSNDGGREIERYNVYVDGIAHSHTESRTATITGLTNGQEYVFTVAAVNSEGEGTHASAKATPKESAGFTTAATNGEQTVEVAPGVLWAGFTILALGAVMGVGGLLKNRWPLITGGGAVAVFGVIVLISGRFLTEALL